MLTFWFIPQTKRRIIKSDHMNKPCQTLGIVLSLILLSSCKEIPPKNGEKGQETEITIEEGKSGGLTIISPDQIVIRFPKDYGPQEKKDFRSKFPILIDSIKKCSCGDDNLELWTFDMDNTPLLEVEEAKRALTSNEPPPNVEGDHQFDFTFPVIEGRYGISGKPRSTYESFQPDTLLRNTTDKAINLVIIDSGVDYYRSKYSAPFLYDTRNTIAGCENQVSGWNFVERNADVTDGNGHGTNVLKTITSQFNENDPTYRILPVKAFDSTGTGTYWDIICATSYVNIIQKRNKNIHGVNMSFGNSLQGVVNNNGTGQEILKDIIDQLEESTIVVTSAGNNGIDNDVVGNEHFPSGFDSNNILGVGGYVLVNDMPVTSGHINNGNDVHTGNYGALSIDVVAPWAGYSYTFSDREGNVFTVNPEGSSYATAFTTARLAQRIYSKNLNNSGHFESDATLIKNQFLNDPILVKHNSLLSQFINGGKYQLKNN